MADSNPPTRTAKQEFWDAVDQWKALAAKLGAAAEAYRIEKARGLLNSGMKTEAMKTADADIATAQLRTERDRLALETRAAEWVVQFLIAEQAR